MVRIAASSSGTPRRSASLRRSGGSPPQQVPAGRHDLDVGYFAPACDRGVEAQAGALFQFLGGISSLPLAPLEALGACKVYPGADKPVECPCIENNPGNRVMRISSVGTRPSGFLGRPSSNA
jgi:hypothetical protein